MRPDMGFGETEYRAVRKIRRARDEIIHVAARLQAGGTDTSALTPPLVEIQEALADLESPGAPHAQPHAPPHPEPARGRRMNIPPAGEGGGEGFADAPPPEAEIPEPPASGEEASGQETSGEELSGEELSGEEASVVAFDSDRAAAAAAIMSLIADKTRLQILATLAGGELTVGELCTRLGCAQPTTSHHLALLRQAGMVSGRRDKKRVHYRLGARARCVSPGVIDVAVDAASVRLKLPIASRGLGSR
jgi:DNA-binding transcriptional ArsR family regulator